MTEPDAATLKADAALGVLVGIAADMFVPGLLAPPADPRLAQAGYAVRGHITMLDAILPPLGPLQLGEKAYYGLLLESMQNPGEFVASIRGTADTAEWIIDAEVKLVPHHAGGHVEDGFNSLMQSARYRPLGSATDTTLVAGIMQPIGTGSLTVIGHSLGAAVAELATLEFVLLHGMADRVRGRFFAAPRVGDADFASIFASCVKDAIGFALQGDIVPTVPPDILGYSPLHCQRIIGPDIAQAIIKDSKTCFHHVWVYASTLDYSLLDWQTEPPLDRDLTACILGPAPRITPSA
jgi:Lipase (class 3)